MNKSINKLKSGISIGSGSATYIIEKKSDELITLRTSKSGSVRFIPTQLISDLLDKLFQKEITLKNILDRKVNDVHVLDFLKLDYDKFIFGYERNIHDLCKFCIENYTELIEDLNYKSFHKITKEANLMFSEKLIARFVSSLCTKPFVILSGLSGSGKTKLAQSFTQWICEDDEQYKIVPVGSDWTNREPLLGYPNSLDSKNYVKPENGVLDLIIKANNNQTKPYFLILDEMNLSHVERYFADFLSTMESNGFIPLHSDKDGKEDVPFKIKLPDNFFVIGTVNIDETTYMFSPKVLDRANVIEFRISDKEMEYFLENPSKPDLEKLARKGSNMALSFLDLSRKNDFENNDMINTNKVLVNFFKELKKLGSEFGYRSSTEIHRFINVVNLIDFDDEWKNDMKIDAAIMQKLLPKVHGSRRKLEPILKTLAELCVKESVDIKKDIFDSKELINFEDDERINFPISLEKISRMYRGIIDNGFASYAEA